MKYPILYEDGNQRFVMVNKDEYIIEWQAGLRLYSDTGRYLLKGDSIFLNSTSKSEFPKIYVKQYFNPFLAWRKVHFYIDYDYRGVPLFVLELNFINVSGNYETVFLDWDKSMYYLDKSYALYPEVIQRVKDFRLVSRISCGNRYYSNVYKVPPRSLANCLKVRIPKVPFVGNDTLYISGDSLIYGSFCEGRWYMVRKD